MFQCQHGRSAKDEGAYHAFRHVTGCSAEELRTFVVEYMQFNGDTVELLANSFGLSDFKEYFHRNAVACILPKPDIFLIYLLCRALGMHAAVAHKNGVWRTSTSAEEPVNFCFVFAHTGFQAYKVSCERPTCVPIVKEDPEETPVQDPKEPDWTQVKPPQDKMPCSSLQPGKKFKSCGSLLMELAEKVHSEFPDTLHATGSEAATVTVADTYPEACATPSDTGGHKS